MKLIKIAQDHYIIVDDSKIQEGDVIYLLYGNTPSTKQGGIARCEFPDANNLGVLWKKITHSTQPESLGMGWMQSVLPLLLSEVKELIGEVDVEKKAERDRLDTGWEDSANLPYTSGFVRGYNQALEDNKEKKWTDEDVIRIVEKSRKTGLTAEYLMMTFQPKTEWEVEFVDGKLALKK